jgi:Protein of unknown function (DUF3489)
MALQLREHLRALSPSALHDLGDRQFAVVVENRIESRRSQTYAGDSIEGGDADLARRGRKERQSGDHARDAIGAGDGMNASDRSPPKAARASAISKTPPAKASAQPELRSTDGALRPGSKQALVIEMLSREDGASLDALVKVTGWLPHTTRAALTGLRKKGYALERLRDESKGSLYRIVEKPRAAIGA